MIHDFDRTMEKLLTERGKFSKTDIDISFEQPNSEWSSKLNRPTLNCWAFDLRENLKLRNMEMTTTRAEKIGKKGLPPMRFNLSYLVTAWGRRIEDEHQLIWRALAALVQTPFLNPDDCEGAIKDQPYEIPIQVAQPIENGVNLTDLWSVLNNDMRLGFIVMVTLALDVERAISGPLVFDRTLRIGESFNPPDHQLESFEELRIGQQKDKKTKEGKKK